MGLAYILIGLVSIGSLGIFLGWVLYQGKKIAQGEAAIIENKKKNKYIKDVDKIVQKSEAYDKKIHDAYAARESATVLRILRDVYTAPDKTKDAG